MPIEAVPGGNNHHLWSPRKHYRSGVRRKFHDLKCQQVSIDQFAHHLVHLYYGHPLEPSLEDMEKAIARHELKLCSCYRSK